MLRHMLTLFAIFISHMILIHFHILSTLPKNEDNSPYIHTQLSANQDICNLPLAHPYHRQGFSCLVYQDLFLEVSSQLGVPSGKSSYISQAVWRGQSMLMYLPLSMSRNFRSVIVSEPAVPTPVWTFSSNFSKTTWYVYKFEWISYFKAVSIKHTHFLSP